MRSIPILLFAYVLAFADNEVITTFRLIWIILFLVIAYVQIAMFEKVVFEGYIKPTIETFVDWYIKDVNNRLDN